MRYMLVLVAFLTIFGCGDNAEEYKGATDILSVGAAPSVVPNNCPATLYKNTSDMRLIPHGEFVMGGAPESRNHRTPEWTAVTDTYWIDANEVTVGEFMMFVDITGYQTASWMIVDDQRPFEPDNYIESQLFYSYPVQVTWEEATAYVKWVGKRLPTEIEWEKAARGGIEGGMFPWGDADPTVANVRQTRRSTMATEGAFMFSMHDGRSADLWRGLPLGWYDPDQWWFAIQPVCSYAPNRYGLFDMIGNVNEWCSDGWNENAYLLFMNGIQPNELRESENVPLKVVRGGGFQHDMDMWEKRDALDTATDKNVRMFYESTIHIGERTKQRSWDYGFTGFRCVMDYDETSDFTVKSWTLCD